VKTYFLPKNVLKNSNNEWLFLVFVVSCHACTESKPKTASS